MREDFNLTQYMSDGIENIVKNVLKSSIKNPKETAFVVKHVLTVKNARNKRMMLENKGEHVPPLLMLSISTNCNLYCKGCYARANKACGDNLNKDELTEERWKEIFDEAKDMGISFALLLGGEPLMRRGIIEKAASVREIIFPIFTNGTMIDDKYVKLFDKNRNLVPMISIEGDRLQTDKRRGIGTYEAVSHAMNKLKRKDVLFGGSVTVTTENIGTVTSKEFVQELYNKGARALIYVEYVPVTKNTKNLAPGDKERKRLEKKLQELRTIFNAMVLLSFPGDEKYLKGCLAAGRGFFHINASGGAEPCPFSPYSDVNLKECNLMEALKSPLFRKLQNNEMLIEGHVGGCLLFEKEDKVKGLLRQQ